MSGCARRVGCDVQHRACNMTRGVRHAAHSQHGASRAIGRGRPSRACARAAVLVRVSASTRVSAHAACSGYNTALRKRTDRGAGSGGSVRIYRALHACARCTVRFRASVCSLHRSLQHWPFHWPFPLSATETRLPPVPRVPSRLITPEAISKSPCFAAGRAGGEAAAFDCAVAAGQARAAARY